MATANVTVTAPYSTAKTATSTLFTGATKIVHDFEREMVVVYHPDGISEFEWETIATHTNTISGQTSTIAIST